MYFRETWKNVIAEEMGWSDFLFKTETRRPCKHREILIYKSTPQQFGKMIATVKQPIGRSFRIKWQVGRTYAIQPGMYESSIGRFQILRIWREPLRAITRSSAVKEGFCSLEDFQSTWIDLYGKGKLFSWDRNPDVWGISFKVVEVYRDLVAQLLGAPHAARKASRSKTRR
jgi:hypothetical protein